MAYNKFIGNENGIVRLQNKVIWQDVEGMARDMDIPVQWVFNAVLDAILCGYVYGTRSFWNEVEYQTISAYLRR